MADGNAVQAQDHRNIPNGSRPDKDPAADAAPRWQPDTDLRVALDACADLIAIKDPTGRYLYANPAMARALGHPAEAVIDKTDGDLLPPDQATQGTADDRQVLDSGLGLTRERPFGANPGLAWTSVRTDPIVVNGHGVAVIIVVRDISHRIETERRLRANSSLLDRFFSQGLVAVAYLDRALTILRVNEAFTRINGGHPEAFVGRPYGEAVPNSVLLGVLRQVLESGTPISERAHRVPSPEEPTHATTYWDYTVQPVRDVGGGVDGLILTLTNATDRVMTEEALRHSEEQYRLLAEQQMALIVKVDTKGRLLYVNPAYCEVFGKPAAELLGQTYMDWVHEDDRASTAAAIASLTHPPHTCRLEQRALTTGGWRWLAWQTTAVLDGTAEVQEVVGVGWDITAQRQAEERLATTIADLERAQRLAHIGSWRLDPATGIPDWSTEIFRIYDRDPGQGALYLVELEDYLEDPDRTAFRSAVEKAVHHGQPFEITLCLRLPNNRIKWIHVRGEPDPAPGPAGHVVRGIAQDITAHRKVEQALRQSEARYRLIAENVSDIIAVFGVDEGVFRYVSPSTRALLGRAPQDIIGTTPFDLACPDDIPAMRTALQDAMSRMETASVRHRLRHLDGQWVWLETHITAARDPDSGAFVEVIGLSRDISQQVHREEELQRSQQLCRGLFDDASAVMLLVDPNTGEILKANASATAFYGYDQATLQSLFIEDINTMPAEQLRDQRRRARMGNKTPFQFTHRVANGDLRYVEVYASPLDLDGRTMLFSIIHDVTDRQQMETALRISEREKSLILSSVSDLVLFFCSPDLTIRWCNQAAAQALETDAAALIGTRCHEVWKGRTCPFSDCPVLRCFDSGTPTEAEQVTPDDRIWTIHTYPTFNEQGDLCGVVEVARDITEQRATAAALSRSLANFHTFFDSSRDYLTVLDSTGHILAVNRAVEERMGWPADILIGQHVTILHPEEMRDQAMGQCQVVLSDDTKICTLPFVTRDGRHVPVETTVVHGTWNDQPAVIGTSRDISDLALSQQLFETAFRDNATLMLLTDPDSGRVIDVNTAFLTTFGWRVGDVIGKTTLDIGLMENMDSRQSLIETLMQARPGTWVEWESHARDGRIVIGEVASRIICNGSQTYLLTMINDVTQQRALMKELEHKATHDPLTGIFNRQEADRVLDQEMRRADRMKTPLSIILADLDRFKTVNDTLGHLGGDKVLCEVVNRILHRIRETDLLARWGGEEFLIILPGTDEQGARRLAETLRRAVADTPLRNAGSITLSQGVAIYLPGESRTDWIARADAALYAAKATGRNRVCCD